MGIHQVPLDVPSLKWLNRKNVGPAVCMGMMEPGPALPRSSHESVDCEFPICLSSRTKAMEMTLCFANQATLGNCSWATENI